MNLNAIFNENLLLSPYILLLEFPIKKKIKEDIVAI